VVAGAGEEMASRQTKTCGAHGAGGVQTLAIWEREGAGRGHGPNIGLSLPFQLPGR
jgi:hypothetical protein